MKDRANHGAIKIGIYRVVGREKTRIAEVTAACEGPPTIDDIAAAFNRWATDQVYDGAIEGCVSRYEFDTVNRSATVAWGPCPVGSCGNCLTHIAAVTGIG